MGGKKGGGGGWLVMDGKGACIIGVSGMMRSVDGWDVTGEGRTI